MKSTAETSANDFAPRKRWVDQSVFDFTHIFGGKIQINLSLMWVFLGGQVHEYILLGKRGSWLHLLHLEH